MSESESVFPAPDSSFQAVKEKRPSTELEGSERKEDCTPQHPSLHQSLHPFQGVIVQKKEKRPSTELEGSESKEDFLLTYDEFQPFHFQQFKNNDKVQLLDFPSFSQVCYKLR